jgi:broad specificity phosphatase PhoE
MTKKTTVYLVRHGQTEWNAARKMQGHQDSPLTELGIKQASHLQNAIQHLNFDVVYASPSLRARRTAEILCEQRAGEIIFNDDLREIHLGNWEGQYIADLQQQYAVAYTAFWEQPHLYQPENGGESFFDLQKRVVPLFTSILDRHAGETVLIVAHGATLKTILAHVEKRPLAHLWHPPILHPTALCKIGVEDQQPFVEVYGDVSHYRETES